MTAAVELFHIESPYLIRNLRDRIQLRKGELIQQLCIAMDWPDFKQRVGVIAGLNEALLIIDQMEKNERN